jgi:rubrerythrin
MTAVTQMSNEQLQQKLNATNKKVKYAWAKYYSEIRTHLIEDRTQYITITKIQTQLIDNQSIPTHIKSELKEMAQILKKKWECPICMDFIEVDNLDITNCGHYYCKGCLEQWKTTEKNKGNDKWTCAICKKKHTFD